MSQVLNINFSYAEFFSQLSVESSSLSSPPPPATPPPPQGMPYNVAAGLGTKTTKGAMVQNLRYTLREIVR